MPQSAQVPGGVVSSLQGRANVIPAGEKNARPLQEGDLIQPGDVILAGQDAKLEITDADDKAWMPRDMELALAEVSDKAGDKKHAHAHDTDQANDKSLDDVINAVDRGDEDAAAAAGLTGGAGGAMSLGLRVDRVIETVTPQEFEYSTPDRAATGQFIAAGQPASTTDAVNHAPVINDPGNPNFDPKTHNYQFITDEDKPVKGQVKATDPDGDPLTFSKGSDPQHGTLVVNSTDGTWTYKPSTNYNGSDSFTVTVSDGKGGTATSTISIGITPVNEAPKIDDPNSPNYDPVTGHYAANTDENKPVSGQVKATDPDGDPLTYAKGSDPQHGTVTVNADGIWTYTPSKDYSGADSFTVTVSDGRGGTTTATVDIGVNPVNEPPIISDPGNPNLDPGTGHYSLTTDENKSVAGQVKATDPDGDPLTYAKGSDPQHGTVTVNADGTWTYTPSKDYSGADSFTVTVSDGRGGTTTATIDIGVNPVNEPPKIDDPNSPNYDPVTGHYAANTDENKPVSGQVKATDPDGDPLTYAKGSDPQHGTVTVNADGTWTYTPSKDYSGADSFTVTVSDGRGGTTTATIDIGVNPVNEPPIISDPGNPNLDPGTGHYSLTTDENKSVAGQVKATDPDGDPLTYAKGSDPQHGTVTVNADGTWTYTPSKDYSGADSFTVTVSDGRGGTTTATIDIGVNPVNEPPKIDDPNSPNYDPVTGHYAANTDENKPVSGQVKATDPDGDPLTYAKGSDPQHGTVTVNADGTWTYTPSKDYSGADSFTVTVSDGRGGTTTATIDIGINPVSEPPKSDDHGIPNSDPVTGNYAVTTDEDKPVSGQVKATDPDGDALTYAKGSDPQHGSVTVKADGTWTYTPSKDYSGADSFTVTVSDGHGGTTTSTINIGVNPVSATPSGGSTDKSDTPCSHDSSGQGKSSDTDDHHGGHSPSQTRDTSANGNHAPTVYAGNDGHNILGLVDLSLNPLLNLSKSQHVAVGDVDNNLLRVDVSVGQFLSLGTLLGDHSKLSLSLDASLTQGLHISGNDSRHLVIESDTAGHTIDMAQVNKLLATLSYDPAHVLGVSVDLFPQLTIKATDAAGATASKTISSSLVAVDVDLTPQAQEDHVEHVVSGSGHHQGSCDSDVFAWTLADKPAHGDTHHVDTITDFNCAARSAGGDVLDLRDLLHTDHSTTSASSNSVDKLLNFLDFDTQSQPGSTIIHVSASGGFHTDAHGHSDSSGCADHQQIVLANVDIRASMGLDQSANDHQVIAELINRGKLLVDHS